MVSFCSNTQTILKGFAGGSAIKNLPADARDAGDTGFDPWVGKIPWSKKWQPTSTLLPGKFHGPGSLVGYRPWGCKDSDMTEHTAHTQRVEVRLSGGQNFLLFSQFGPRSLPIGIAVFCRAHISPGQPHNESWLFNNRLLEEQRASWRKDWYASGLLTLCLTPPQWVW